MKRSCSKYIHERVHKEYQLCSNIDDKRYDRSTHDIACQFDSKCGDVKCTCKNKSSKRRQEVKYFGRFPKQVYTYHKTSFADIGVSRVKTVQKKRVKRIYLPETDNRGVGSSDLSSFIISRKPRYARGSYYDHKKTSSKCVGGVSQSTIECVISAKLSPLLRTNSASTSPKTEDEETNIETGSSALKRNVVTTTTQVENEYIESETGKPTVITQQFPKEKTVSNPQLGNKQSREIIITPINKNVIEATEKVYSSDSLVQHIHNLEDPSEDKQSHTSLDPMENKLEREYRRMFSTKSKDPKLISEQPTPDLKSASLLRRRFEALRRGLAQKEDSKKNAVIINKELSPTTVPSKRDVSIASDPPSLEARSYSFTKAYSPYESLYNQETDRNPKVAYKKSVVNKKEKGSLLWSRTGDGNDEEGVKGMFKLWGKKFDFEEENFKNASLKLSYTKAPKKVQKELDTWVAPKTETESKKGKKFFFFGKKSKDKTKPYKPKKGVTAGRCEVKDGLVIKIGRVNDYAVQEAVTKKEPEKPICESISDECEGILRKAWLKKFLEQTIESKNSVQIRWNNKMYTTSSSTVFELMDNVYKQTEVALKSKSEISTGDSSLYQAFKRQQVNFVQDIEAWMIPKIIPERRKQLPVNIFNNNVDKINNIKFKKVDRKGFIDKSKAFAHKIEVVLHSKNFMNRKKDPSSEYLRIDIPKGFFSDSVIISDEQAETSNSEEVYKIVEYETSESNTRFRINKSLDTGHFLRNDINVTVSIKDINLESTVLETDIKKPTLHRDVVIQGSNVCVPRLCDVIGVGIITHRDIREIRKPILKIQYDYSDEESDYEHALKSNQKTCEFAESYLQDFYRHWTPLGMEVYSWCVSDSHLQCGSENSQIGVHNQGDGTKSCPNICEDYQGSTIVSSCTTSSCSHCNNGRHQQPSKSKFFCKFKRKTKSEPKENPDKRVLPKDSFEVFRKRKLYACSNRSKWLCADDRPYSIPSIEDKCEDTSAKSKTLCCEPKKKPCKKHVSLPGCDVINDLLTKQLSENVSGILLFKGAAGCDACKNNDFCAKHTKLTKSPPCEIPQPPCKDSCEKKRKPECSKPNQPSCNVPKPSYEVACTPPGGSPPCQKKPCPPTPPPCYVISGSPKCPPPSCPSTPPVCPKPQITPPAEINTPPSSTSICPKPTPPCPPPPICPKPSPPPVCPNPPPKPNCFKPASPCPTPPCSHTPPCPPPPCPRSPPPPPCHRPPPCSHIQSCTPAPPCSCSPCPKPVYQHSRPCPSSPPLCTASPPCGALKKGSFDSIKNLFKKKTHCEPLPPSCCRQPIPTCSSKASRKKTKHSSCTPSPPCSPKSSIRIMKSPCDCCTKNQFPWPMKNQVSNQSSSASCNKSPQEKSLQVTPRYSQTDCQTQETPVCAKPCPKPKSGLYLKMKALCPPPKKGCGTAPFPSRLSDENIRIRLNKTTPSTEEIRENLNIKVQDADGQTLYERRDYTTHHSSVMGEMYNVHRASTQKVQNVKLEENNNVEQVKSRSETSIANQIEIHFIIKLTPGNKTTEMKIDNDGEIETEKPENSARQTSQDVFVVNEADEPTVENCNGKNDINIKIVIKNFKPKFKKEKISEDYSKKISEKFHSVSTGYSVIDDQIFSLHETKTEVKSSEEIMNQEFAEKPATSTETIHNVAVAIHKEQDIEDSNIGKNSKNNKIENQIIIAEDTTKLNIQTQPTIVEIQEQKSVVPVCATDEDEQENNLEITSDEPDYFNSADNIKKPTKQQKKEMLKKVFEKAADMKKGKRKNRMHILRKMLKTILTSDSSDREEITAPSNDLAKDVTYASLKPNYFRDTDSMNNYYNNDSIVLNSDDECKMKPTYPTEEHSAVSKESDLSEPSQPQTSCVCSTFAERLNLNTTVGGGCCCRSIPPPKIDEETCCDLRNEIDLFLLNYKTAEYCDVEIQSSIKSNKVVKRMSIAEVKSSKMSKVMDDMSKKTLTNSTQEKKIIKSKILRRTFSPRVGHVKECATRRLNKHTMLGISDKDKIYVINNSSNKNKERKISRKETVYYTKTADILQSYETKKAVLEIYAEKIFSKNGERLVAKLPKFVYDKENEIERNYREIVAKYNTVSDGNIVL